MNEKREKLNTPAYSRAPRVRINREDNLPLYSSIPAIADHAERETAVPLREETTLPSTRFEVPAEAISGPDILTTGERAGYLVRGAGWSVVTLLAFGLNGVVLVFDGGLLNLLFTTTGYLAYKQFKAAITGTAHTCLKFVCTLQTVKNNISKVVTAVKNRIHGVLVNATGKTCVECVA